MVSNFNQLRNTAFLILIGCNLRPFPALFISGVRRRKGDENKHAETRELRATADEAVRDGVQVSGTTFRRGKGVSS